MQNTQLTIADLASLRSLLQAAYSRGAFRIEEASQVGAIFDRLSAFLDQQPAKEQSEPATQGETNA
jgi:hypothetical protein